MLYLEISCMYNYLKYSNLQFEVIWISCFRDFVATKTIAQYKFHSYPIYHNLKVQRIKKDIALNRK